MRIAIHSGIVLRVSFLLFGFLGLAACSGGGGGGDGGGIAPVVYAGNLNGAVVTETNAKPLASAAISSGAIGGSLVGASIDETAPSSGQPELAKIALALRKSLTRADRGPPIAGATHLNESGTELCLLSGSVTSNITVNDNTGNYNGNISFSACSDTSGESISGSISVSGHISGPNSSNPQLDQLNTDGTLSYTDATGTYAFTGTLAISFSYANPSADEPNGFTILVNIDVRKNGSPIFLRAANYTLTSVITPSYVDVTLSGTVCHSVEGCVTVATIIPLRYVGTDLWPSSGQLTVTGAGNAKVRLTALNNAQYTLEWDTNGDGAYDGSLVAQPWSTL